MSLYDIQRGPNNPVGKSRIMINGVIVEGGSGGGSSVTSYLQLADKPTINSVPIEGNITLDQLGLEDITIISDADIDKLF